MIRIYCLAFGHKIPEGCDPESSFCDRCGSYLEYADFVEPSMFVKFKDSAVYYSFRKWVPDKCACGKRYGGHYNCPPF